MPGTHVCLISAQPIPNLLPLFLEKPDKAVFLVSPQMSDQADRLEKVLKPCGIQIETRKISAYDFEQALGACQAVLSETHPAPLTLNVTGGTKIAALAAFQAFFFDNQRTIYCDTDSHRLLTLAPQSGEQSLLENLISVRDYLTAYGTPPITDGKPPTGGESRRPHLAALAKLLVENEDLLSKLNSAVDKEKKDYATVSLNALGKQAEELASLLAACEVASLVGGNSINIKNKEMKFFCAGGWLEEYTYEMVRRLGIKGLDLTMNVKVQWEEGKGNRQTENEFDILFTHHNQLHLISCKASNPERQSASGSKLTEALNELDTLKDRVGGLFGKGMLVSARRLRDEDRERAKKMRIELVDGREVLRLNERLKTWLG